MVRWRRATRKSKAQTRRLRATFPGYSRPIGAMRDGVIALPVKVRIGWINQVQDTSREATRLASRISPVAILPTMTAAPATSAGPLLAFRT